MGSRGVQGKVGAGERAKDVREGRQESTQD